MCFGTSLSKGQDPFFSPPPTAPPPQAGMVSWVQRLAAAGLAGLADWSQGTLSSALRLFLEEE